MKPYPGGCPGSGPRTEPCYDSFNYVTGLTKRAPNDLEERITKLEDRLNKIEKALLGKDNQKAMQAILERARLK